MFNRNDYATFISTVFENVYMVKLVRVPRSGSASGLVQVRGRDNKSLIGIMLYSIPFEAAPLHSYIGDFLI